MYRMYQIMASAAEVLLLAAGAALMILAARSLL